MSALFHLLSMGIHRVAGALSSSSGFMVRHLGPASVAALSLIAAMVAGYAVMLFVAGPRGELAEILRPYRLLPAVPKTPKTPVGTFSVTQPILRRAANALSDAIESRGWRPTLEAQLRRAGLPIGAGEFLLVTLVGTVVMMAFGDLIVGIVGAFLGLIAGAAAAFLLVRVRADQRYRKFSSQLPDVLKLIASSMRGGFSLLQSLNSVVENIGEPMQHELKVALSRTRLGEPIEEALGEIAERTGSRDFAWTVMAIRIQREVGGNLAEILDTVAMTMIERERLRREVRTLTAEGRISAVILAALPVALGLFILVANHPYISLLFTTLPGEAALGTGVLMEIVGAWWMNKTIQIEV